MSTADEPRPVEGTVSNATVTIPAEEYEVLRLIQFYARHDPEGDTLIGQFIRLDKLDKAKVANDGHERREP